MPSFKHNVADESGVRVMRERCATCIFKPGNLMELRPGRQKDMLDEVKRIDGCIPCHETLEDEIQAVCKGQFDAHQSSPLQLAERLDAIVWWDRQKGNSNGHS